MVTPLRAPLRLLAAVSVAVTLIGGCTDDRDTKAAPSRTAPAEVVVASFNFPESELLAELYAQILADRGIPIRLELDLGRRERVLPALQQGLVDVVPEYVGSVTAALAPEQSTDARDPSAVRGRLADLLAPWHARPLRLSAAENVNAVVVTRETSERLHIRTVSDLAPVAPTLTLGGPPECPVRPYCLRGLEQDYGLHFAEFVPLEGEQLVRRALEDGVVDAGIMFTTDGTLARHDFSSLADDRGLQPADNVVPVVRDESIERHGIRLTRALDAVSARLTTRSLRVLNWRVTVAGHRPADEARAWLVRHGLVSRAA